MRPLIMPPVFALYRGYRKCFESLSAILLLAAAVASAGPASAQERTPLPSPLRLEDVLSYGRSHRQEIIAAKARARAAAQKPAIVSALDDPMVMPSIDHLPYMGGGFNRSLMVEQRFPLSGLLGHRRRAAEADARKYSADADRVIQDVLLDATRAFLMLNEQRETALILDQQLGLARQFVQASNARYGAGNGGQSDVLRAEIEVARLQAGVRTIRIEVAAAEAMLNASLGRLPDAPVPALVVPQNVEEPRPWNEVQQSMIAKRPELAVGRAEIERTPDANTRRLGCVSWPI